MKTARQFLLAAAITAVCPLLHASGLRDAPLPMLVDLLQNWSGKEIRADPGIDFDRIVSIQLGENQPKEKIRPLVLAALKEQAHIEVVDASDGVMYLRLLPATTAAGAASTAKPEPATGPAAAPKP